MIPFAQDEAYPRKPWWAVTLAVLLGPWGLLYTSSLLAVGALILIGRSGIVAAAVALATLATHAWAGTPVAAAVVFAAANVFECLVSTLTDVLGMSIQPEDP